MSRSIRHSAATVEWGTPDDFIERSRAALGGAIDLDPMTTREFNERVGAARIFTKDDDGIVQPWVAERLFINPAGGLIREAWGKLSRELLAGNIKSAIWIGFSLEQLALLADPVDLGETDAERWARGVFYPTDFSLLICRKRISFVRGDGYKGGPTHGNYVVGIGVMHCRFMAHFHDKGRVMRGPLSVDD